MDIFSYQDYQNHKPKIIEGMSNPDCALFNAVSSLFDREAKGMLGFLDVNIHADNSQTHTVFDWTPRSLRESVLDSARAVKAISS